MSVPGELYALVERFDRDRDSYRSGMYNEAQARVDFINPLLGLLGWGVENREGRPEAYRDVVYEDRVKVGGGTKAPDYGGSTSAGGAASSSRRRSPLSTSRGRGPCGAAQALRVVCAVAALGLDGLRGVRDLRLPLRAGE